MGSCIPPKAMEQKSTKSKIGNQDRSRNLKRRSMSDNALRNANKNLDKDSSYNRGDSQILRVRKSSAKAWSLSTNSVFYSHKYLIRPNLVGLKNLGNTCYMNSIIQCISYLPGIDEHLKSAKSKLGKALLVVISDLNSGKFILNHLKELKSAINKNMKTLNNSLPNDSKYFFSQLLNCLRKENPELARRFILKTDYEHYCKNCKKISHENNEELFFTFAVKNTIHVTQLDIDEKLNTLKEMGNKAGFFCENCNKLVKPVKKDKLAISLPKTLVIYLGESKKPTKLSFPFELNLRDTKEKGKYYLASVCNGLPGHATATVKWNNEWCYMNDEIVTKIRDPFSNYAILLFYQRMSRKNKFNQ